MRLFLLKISTTSNRVSIVGTSNTEVNDSIQIFRDPPVEGARRDIRRNLSPTIYRVSMSNETLIPKYCLREINCSEQTLSLIVTTGCHHIRSTSTWEYCWWFQDSPLSWDQSWGDSFLQFAEILAHGKLTTSEPSYRIECAGKRQSVTFSTYLSKQ